MSSIGAEAWACGRPVFYNVCISLSKMSGPVIHDHPASAPTPAPAHATPLREQNPHSEVTSPAPAQPVLTQPTARKEVGGMGVGEARCKCGEGGGARRKINDRRGHRCGRARALRVAGDVWPGVGAGLKEEEEEEEEEGEGEARAPGREALHRTVITLSGDGKAGQAPGNASAAHEAPVRPARRYSTVVSLEAGGRTLCTSRALDEGKGEEGDADGFLLRKVSHTSDYSLSSHSDSSVSSASPGPSRRTSQDTAHDSDYYGSSGEEEEEEGGEGAEKDSANDSDSDSDNEDVSARLRAAMARLQATEASRLGFRRTAGGLRASRWRRRAPIKEYDLEQRIALEIKMREGTTKLLAACGGAQGPRSNLPHTLEAAKNLLTSNERMTAYMAELQRRRGASGCADGSQPSLSRVCLSDLRMPLIWKDSDHFKNKGDYRRFAVFVLLKIGTEIYDTVMVNPVDRSMTDICFDDIIVFNGIPSGFECSLEVYSHVLQNDLTMASTPRKLKRTLHSSISRTVGRKLAASLRDELSHGELGPKFELVATAKLTLDNVSNNTATFDLNMENVENRANQLPLFGHFCCRLAAQPDCATQERVAGYAHVAESEQQNSWCRLFGWQLEVWNSKEDVHLSPHHPLSLSVDRNTEVTLNGSQVVVSNTTGFDRGSLTLGLDSPSEASSWYRCLQQHIADHRLWGAAAEEEMEILTPQPTRHNFILPRRGRFTSLYEETPLRDGSPSSEKSSLDDIYGSSAFVNNYCTPAQVTRPRAMTLASRSSFRRWGSVKCNMPFFKSKS